MQILILLLIISIASTLYLTRWLPIEVTATLTIVSLSLTGILSPDQAFAGFSNAATLTVAAMFVLSAGLMRTGALEIVTIQLARLSKGNPSRLLLLLGITIPPISAFVNNTPIVVLMVPVVLSLSRQFQIRVSKLLLPVSYFAILGGTITLLGTSTNILVANLYHQTTGHSLDLFAFTPLGLIYATVGILYIVLIGPRLLPDRPHLAEYGGATRTSEYMTELVVGVNSRLVGQKANAHFAPASKWNDRPAADQIMPSRRRIGRTPPTRTGKQETARDRVEILEIFRGEVILRGKEALEATLWVNDVLLVAGSPQAVSHLLESTRSDVATVLEDEQRVPIRSLDQMVVEAVVLPDSPCNGRSAGSLGFHRLHAVKVMGVQRHGRQHRIGLRNLRLESGDVLLLQGTWEGLHAACEVNKLLLVEGVEGTLVRKGKHWLALIIMLGVVLVASLTPIPIVVLATAGAILIILTRCLRLDEAFRSLDTSTLFLLAGTIPLGSAMDQTGLAQFIADGVLQVTGHTSPIIFLSAFYLLTSILTEILSNNAVAVLLTPIAFQFAAALNLDPIPLLMAIAFGASASFMTPIGYQTNAIVMGPGGYTFKDYLKIGVPLNLIMWITATIFIPILWPLSPAP